YLFDPKNDAEVYEEFACVWLELRHFEPDRLAAFFPAADPVAVEGVLAGDLDSDALFRTTRPEGAFDPAQEAEEPPEPPLLPEGADASAPGELRSRADELARRGNLVRAAVLRHKAIRGAPPTQAGALRGAARSEIDQLTDRLERALHFPARDREDWQRC